MARHFTVTLTSGTNIGPYTIYHTSSTNGNEALLHGTTNPATNLTLAQVQGGVLITVPDSATSVIFYNNNATMISDCPTNIVEYPLTLSATPQPTPPPTYGSTPQPTPNPSATPQKTPSPSNDATPPPTPDATPNPTPDATPDATPQSTPPPTYGTTPEPTPPPSGERNYSSFYRSTVKSTLGATELGTGFCDNENGYLVNTLFYVQGADRTLHSSLESQNVYTDVNFTNPLPNGFYYVSATSVEAGATTFTATPGNTYKYIETEFTIGAASTGVHNCGNSDGDDQNN